jgi:hypothetical protein
MNSQDVLDEVTRAARARGWGEDLISDPRTVHLLHLTDLREVYRTVLRARIRSLDSELNRVSDMIARPEPILNPLGELGMAPARVEMAVAQFELASRMVREYLALYPEEET